MVLSLTAIAKVPACRMFLYTTKKSKHLSGCTFRVKQSKSRRREAFYHQQVGPSQENFTITTTIGEHTQTCIVRQYGFDVPVKSMKIK